MVVSKTYQRVMRRAAKNLRAKGLDKADAFCAEMEAIAKRHAERRVVAMNQQQLRDRLTNRRKR